MSGVFNSEDTSTSSFYGNCAKTASQSSKLTKHQRHTLYPRPLGPGRTHVLYVHRSKHGACWERPISQVMLSERHSCPYHYDYFYIQKAAFERIWMLKNLEHSHRLVQLPSGELNGDVAAQACPKTLMTIPQVVSCDKQIVLLAYNGHVLMEPGEDE